MNRRLFIKILLTWILIIPIAIINGILRNNFYQPLVGELPAHQISTIIGAAAFVGLVYLLMRKELAKLNTAQLLIIGITWSTMTIIFEFLFGHYIVGHSWSRLLADYNLLAGRVWSLFLLSVLLTPLLVNKLAMNSLNSAKT